MACLGASTGGRLGGLPGARAGARRQSGQRLGLGQGRVALLRVRAEGENGGGSSGGPGNDWDSAWSSIQRQMRSQVEVRTTTTRPRRPAPRRVLDEQGRPFNGPGSAGSPTPGPSGWGGQEAERIRRAERLLLDIWSGEDFNKAGVVASVILLLAFVLVVGPPPPDGVCSQYWC